MLMITVSGCARKQRTLFTFSESSKPTITKLALPTVKALRAYKTSQGIALEWQPALLEHHHTHGRCKLTLQGYSVYRFIPGKFLPKKSLNQEKIQESHYLDKNRCSLKKLYSYAVRPYFLADGHEVQGPLSHIVCPK